MPSQFLGKRLLVLWHLGLGDAIACRPIIKARADRCRTVWIGAKSHNLESVRALFVDSPSVRVFSLGKRNPDCAQRTLRHIAGLLHIPTLGLGIYGEAFLEPPYLWNFDENFYIQSGVPFSQRVEGDNFPRNLDLERELEYELKIGDEPFYFLHEDSKRGLLIDKERLPRDLIAVRSDRLGYRFPIGAWVGVLLRAKELHVIESSFAALIESLNPDGKKVAHRYARALVLNKPQMEWTYQNEWIIER